MNNERHVPQDTQSVEPGKGYKTFEHRLVDVVGNPSSGETYDAIGREVDATIAAYNRRCARLDAQIAALTERLRAVEAERDEARSGVKKSAEAYGALMEHAEKLRAELQRKDAALRSYHGVLKLLRTNLEFIAQGGNTATSANELIRTYERRAREACCSMDAELNALATALQPKEPPCQTA